MNFTTILFIHNRLAQTAWLFMLLMTLWAAGHYLRNKPLNGQFWGIVAVGEILMLFQALLGLTMLLGWSSQPGRSIHFLYGGLTVIVMPAVYGYSQGWEHRRAALIWVLTGLLMVGLSIRAIGTGFPVAG